MAKFEIPSDVRTPPLGEFITELAYMIEREFGVLSETQGELLTVLKRTDEYCERTDLNMWDADVTAHRTDFPKIGTVEELLHEIVELGMGELYSAFGRQRVYEHIQKIRTLFEKLGKQQPEDAAPKRWGKPKYQMPD